MRLSLPLLFQILSFPFLLKDITILELIYLSCQADHHFNLITGVHYKSGSDNAILSGSQGMWACWVWHMTYDTRSHQCRHFRNELLIYKMLKCVEDELSQYCSLDDYEIDARRWPSLHFNFILYVILIIIVQLRGFATYYNCNKI